MREILYFYYYWGDKTFAERMTKIFAEKDYDSFMEMYKNGEERRLPNHATVFDGHEIVGDLDITDKAVFESLTHTEYEWG